MLCFLHFTIREKYWSRFITQASSQESSSIPTEAKLKSTSQKTKLYLALKACTAYLTAVLLVEIHRFAAPSPSNQERLLLLGKEPIR